MKPRIALPVVALASFLGVLMSGYLSWRNIWGGGCPIDAKTFFTCGGVTIFGQPTCVYGFFMFLIVFLLALAAWGKGGDRGLTKAMLAFSILGTGFSGYLAVYELWFIQPPLISTPSCVYGLILYVLALLFSALALRSHTDIVPTSTPTQGNPVI